MLFIKNWDKASLDKSSNSIIAKYKNKINSLTDKTDALRKLLGELYDEALILNERIKVDKQAIQEDLNETANDLRETCGNSSWGQEEIERAQDLLDRAEEDIEDVKTDIEITTGCLVVCQSGQGAPCSQPCNESTCLIGNAPYNEEPEPEEEPEEPEEDICVVIVNGEFECTGTDSYIQDCYGGCYNNQSCDSQTKVCPKCHGSEIDVTETCWSCDTDQKETCGAFDSQAGCVARNATGNCSTLNTTGDCSTSNDVGDCSNRNDAGDCTINNIQGTCREEVSGNCGTENEATNDLDVDCVILNKEDTVCESINTGGNCNNNNTSGNCYGDNDKGDCYELNSSGTCKRNDSSKVCDVYNTDQRTCTENDVGADYCMKENSTSSDCNVENRYNDCSGFNTTGNCDSFNDSGDCYKSNFAGNCTADNVNEEGEAVGDCTTQSCEAGQECTVCVSDQKETTTTEKCQAGANIGDEEYCDTCQGDESKVEEWDQEELEDLCSSIFEAGADACGTAFANCFNTENCNGSSWGAESGCGSGQGCGTCDTVDSACDSICDSSQEPACGTCDTGDGSCTGCYSGVDCSQSCYPIYSIPGGDECVFGYNLGCGQGSVCPMCFTSEYDCGQGSGCDDSSEPDLD